jgi:hypothetical protein
MDDPRISSLLPKESTGRKFQRKKSHRKGYSQMGAKGRHCFDSDTEKEDGSKEGR